MSVASLVPGNPIAPERDHFPCCIVWCPLPVLSWFVPFVGHMGITTSDGIIHDFGGSYYINKSRQGLVFGRATKFVPVAASDLSMYQSADRPVEAMWDDSVYAADEAYSHMTHNLLLNNCHNHVGDALNRIGYRGKRNWGTMSLMWLLCTRSTYVSTSRLLWTNLPFLIILTIIILLVVFA